MKYILKQYNYTRGVDITDRNFMTSLKSDKISFMSIDSTRYISKKVHCLYNSDLYIAGHSYYFYGIIQQGEKVANINIKLVDRLSSATSETALDTEKIQYVKQITVPSSNPGEYFPFEIVFTPIVNFNSLMFELESDQNNIRLGCVDVAELNNIIENSLEVDNGSPLIRFSIQTIPGFLMCLNGEGIRVPRNGIYEIKNGIILIDSFTPIEHCSTESQTFINWKNSTNPSPYINSDLFGNPDRPFHSFTVDYLYYNVEE